jgi:gliding motility-associated-like protein
MKLIVQFAFLVLISMTNQVVSQSNDCGEEVNVCTTPSFAIIPPGATNTVVDFGSGTGSNPSTNPQGFNSGCLLSGETSSVFMVISVNAAGTLSWTIGTDGSTGCFDWIMWPYTPGGATCTGLQNGTLAPVACNWNGNCEGFTGMAAAGSLPPGGAASNFQTPLNVVPGNQYLLCLSNYSGLGTTVPINFLGTAGISCNGLAPDQTVCQGETANVNILTVGFTNPTYQYLVTTGVANPTGGPTNQITVPVTTAYSVRVCESGLCDTVNFTVNVVNPPVANAGSDTIVCYGAPYLLQGSATGTAPTHTWSMLPNPGFTPPATTTFLPNVSSYTPTATANTGTTYQYVLTASNPTCPADKDTVNVTFQRVALTATKTDPLCNGSADGTITITSVLGNSYSSDNGITWQASPIFTGKVAGTYTVCAKSTLGCKTCITQTLVNPPIVGISATPDVTICQNGSTTMVATGTNGTSFTYTWTQTTDPNASQTIFPIGTATYTVFATNQNGCNSIGEPITVTVLPPLSGVVSDTQYICPGYFVKIGVLGSAGNGGPYTYLWSTGETTDSIIASNLVDMNYTVTIEDNCESTPLILNVFVKVLPVPVVDFTCLIPELCEDAVFQIENATAAAMSGHLNWHISSGETYIDQSLIETLPLSAGAYNVRLIVTSPDGCIDSLTKYNFLISHPKPFANFGWSPNPATVFNTEVKFNNVSFGNDFNYWFMPGADQSYSTEDQPFVMYPDGIVGNYEVTLIVESNFGCRDTVTKMLPILPEILFYAPNTFTPDGDEFNQSWKFNVEGVDITQFNLTIFNRWGQVIFETNDTKVGWDGTFQGRIVEQGIYNWTATAKEIISDKKYEFRGSINVLK